MSDLKTFSLIINWHDGDAEQGTYAWTGRAVDHNAAEDMARSSMRASLADERGCDAAEVDDEFGSVVECSEGALWKAADLESALRRLLSCPDLNLDSLEPETVVAIADARAVLED